MINGPRDIFIERKGKIIKTNASFSDEGSLIAAARNIAQFVGRPLDDENLTMDARLPDGSRVHVVIPPSARNGTTIAIRKFFKVSLTLKDLINFGALSLDAARFIDICVFLAKNIIVSGGTGSGKTTLLSSIASRIPKTQRIIVIEDASELQINQEHVVFFETKAANDEGKGAVTIRDLVKSSLRLRPDRIIVGEVRGAEALDLISSMNTGHSGSMGTVHANSPSETLVRLETLAMMTEVDVPAAAIKAQVGSAIELIICTARLYDGSRKITHISEVLGVDEVGRYLTKDIYRFVQKGRNADGEIIGEMLPTGYVPTFYEDIERNNIPFPRSKFAAGS
ncbi:MAG: CpaF family protein [Oligoflexia bacterium]|nr:CpaF family protein [Oligoflexia bacterium]